MITLVSLLNALKSLYKSLHKYKEITSSISKAVFSFSTVNFTLGTCINNTSVMMFKKGSFEISGDIYPVAIKASVLRASHCLAFVMS